MKRLNILDLNFISILDRLPRTEQFVLIAWDIGGYCGYESTLWDIEDKHCRHAVAWLPMHETHVYTRKCAVAIAKRKRPRLLEWSIHFSNYIAGKYISKERMPSNAHTTKL